MDTIVPVTADHEQLAEDLAAQGVEYVFGSFIDVTGRAKSKAVPVHHLPASVTSDR
jgi:glutamine synthetase